MKKSLPLFLIKLFLITVVLWCCAPFSANSQSCWHLVTDLNWTGTTYPGNVGGTVLVAGNNIGIYPAFNPDASSIWLYFGTPGNYVAATGAVRFQTTFLYSGAYRIFFSYYTGDPEVYINGQKVYYPGDPDDDNHVFENPDLTAYLVNGQNTISIIAHESSLEAEIYEAGPNAPPISATTNVITYPCGNQSDVVLSINPLSSTVWNWSTDNGYIGSGTSISVFPTTSTNYYVSGEGGCVGGNTSTIRIFQNNSAFPVSVTIASSGNGICAGSSVTFTATPHNTQSNPIYQWKINGSPVGTNSPFYTSTTLNNGEVVSCSVLNPACDYPVNSNNFTMTVYPNLTPSITIGQAFPATSTICAGDNVVFTASGTNGIHYSWKVNGSVVTIENNGYTFSAYNTNALADGDVITCEYNKGNIPCTTPTSVTSNALTITVIPVHSPSVTIGVTFGSLIDCTGDPITFTAMPGHEGSTPAYQWKLNGGNVGSNADIYTLATPSNNDVVTCVMTGSEVCASPATATSNSLTINTPVTPHVYIYGTTAFMQENICPSSAWTFLTSQANGGSTPIYNWTLNGNPVGSSDSYTQTGFNDNDEIIVTMTSNAPCATTPTVTDSRIIRVHDASAATLHITNIYGNVPSCIGSMTEIQADARHAGLNPVYHWKKNGLDVAGNPFYPFAYNDNGIINGDVITCSITTDLVCGTTYTIQSNSITMAAIQPLTPTIVISNPNPSLLNSFVATITNGGASPSYNWQRNGTDVGIYGSTYTDPSLVSGDVITCILTSSETCVTTSTATSNPFTFQPAQPIIYCTPGDPFNNACSVFWISNVVLGTTVNQSSPLCSGKYEDYSATGILTATAGQTIPFEITEGSDGTNYGASASIYIDFNGDGVFNDVEEKVVDNVPMYFISPAIGIFPVPALIAPGNYRLRVITASPVTSPPCETDFGEIEDYTLQITEPVYCSGVPPVITNPCDLWISNVTIGSINNTSTQPTICTPGGYTDYSSILYTHAAPDQPVNYTLSSGFSYGNGYQSADIYIDYTGDGNFTDADGEHVVSTSMYNNSYGSVPATGTFTIPPGQPLGYYRMRVKSYDYNNEASTGACGNNDRGEIEDYTLIVDPAAFVPPPANDECAGAVALPCDGSVNGDNTYATDDVLPGTSCGSSALNYRGVWHTITSAYSGICTVSTCTTSLSWDTYLRIYEGTCGSFTQCKGSNDDGCSTLSTISFNVIGGTTYYILLTGASISAFGSYTLTSVCPVSTNCVTPASASATSVTENSATANWTCVGCSGNDFIVEYGLQGFTPGSGATAGMGGTIINVTGVSSVSQVIGSLSNGTSYDYYVRQVCNGGPAFYSENSLKQNFTTLVPGPANDNCGGAINLPCGGSVSGNNSGANNDALPGVTCGTPGSNFRGVWHTITPAYSGTCIISACSTSPAWDTYLRVYGGTCGTLTACMGSNDDQCGLKSTVSFTAVGGTTYYILLTGYANNSYGSYTLTSDCYTPTGTTSLNLKLFIQGYYISGGTMQHVLQNQGVGSNGSLTDNITVELRNQNNPATLISSSSADLMTDGTASVQFNGIYTGSYWIAVKHRNALETWSKLPVSFTTPPSYDFTIGNTQAYGNNEVEVESGKWAFYSGDISDHNCSAMQDGVIESCDYSVIENAFNLNLSGNIVTDLTGDGIVNAEDYDLMQQNVYIVVHSIHP